MSAPLPASSVLPRWDAVVIRWALSSGERSELLACALRGPVTLVGSYRTDEAELRMRLAIELSEALIEAVGDEERVRGWLRRSKPKFGGRTPIELMAISTEWTRRLIDAVGAVS